MRTKAFTLIEVLVVIAIIGLLTAILIPGWVEVVNRRTQTNYLPITQSNESGVEIKNEFEYCPKCGYHLTK